MVKTKQTLNQLKHFLVRNDFPLELLKTLIPEYINFTYSNNYITSVSNERYENHLSIYDLMYMNNLTISSGKFKKFAVLKFTLLYLLSLNDGCISDVMGLYHPNYYLSPLDEIQYRDLLNKNSVKK